MNRYSCDSVLSNAVTLSNYAMTLDNLAAAHATIRVFAAFSDNVRLEVDIMDRTE